MLTGVHVDQRRSLRFPVRAPVLFSWNSSSGIRRGAGFTRDLCTKGVYVICEDECDVGVGQTLMVEILLPPLAVGCDSVRFSGEGHVIRHGTRQEQAGFAVLAYFAIAEPRTDA